MLERWVNIKLLGKMGQQFGREFRLFIVNPAQAIQALCHRFGDEFIKFIYDCEESGIVFRVVNGDPKGINKDELLLSCSDTLVIAPIIAGKGGGFGRVLLGGALLAGSFFMPASISILGASISSMSIGLLGASLVLGGIHQMLSPQPKTPKKSDVERRDSFLFSGTASPGDAGEPVPLPYGEMKITDMTIISIGIKVNEVRI